MAEAPETSQEDPLSVVRALVRRSGREADRWRRPLLLLTAAAPPTGDSPAVGTAGRPRPEWALVTALKTGRGVPYAHLPAGDGDVVDLLDGVRYRLAASTPAGRAQRLTFPHYDLLRWVVETRLGDSAAGPGRRRELADRARELRRLTHGEPASAAPDADVGQLGLPGVDTPVNAQVNLKMAILRKTVTVRREQRCAAALRWARGTGEPWPDDIWDEWSFGAWLSGRWTDDDRPPEVGKLLVHAFLHDLRRAYRRRWWPPSTWRLTAYPVLALDGVVADGPGDQLLSLLQEVRRRPDHHDPLVVVARGTGLPATRPGAGRPYAAWSAGARAAASNGAVDWFLPFAADAGPAGAAETGWPAAAETSGSAATETSGSAATGESGPAAGPVTAPSAWLSTLVLGAAVLVVTLVVGGAVVAYTGTPAWLDRTPPATARQQGPGTGPAAAPPAGAPTGTPVPVTAEQRCTAGQVPGHVATMWLADQCVGYSDTDRRTFGTEPELVEAQRRVLAQNDARPRAGTPVVTLVFLTALTHESPLPSDDIFAGEKEALQGLLLAQVRNNQKAENTPHRPYLRVVVANAGNEARGSRQTVDMINDLTRRDRTVVGVVAAVNSRGDTQQALRRLDQQRLLIVSPTAAADDFGSGIERYLQLQSPNREQARLVHAYATGFLGRSRLVNYYSYGTTGAEPTDDRYVNTLRTRLGEEYARGAGGPGAYRELRWAKQSLREHCDGRADHDEVVFFGGRYTNFPEFLDRLARDCGDDPPVLIADSNVSRYVASRSLRRGAPPGLPLSYVSNGVLAMCAQLIANDRRAGGDPARRDYLAYAREVLGLCTGEHQTIGIRAGMTYDAVTIVLDTAYDVVTGPAGGPAGQAPGTGAITAQEIYDAIPKGEGTVPFAGATGPIRFGRDGVADNGGESLMCVLDLRRAGEPGHLPFEIDRTPFRAHRPGARNIPPPVVRRACDPTAARP